ncbi:MAG TPA: transporter substrate-binding domain-containing protein [Geminicoccus sp.]|jgi:polar amino acid transport system substrate-binding protein|uniref:transporter substrate-binding domain-containing protein n=1 Tax=Geminicoccus sp. TaxID=2024832 RepID=UPI002E3684E5|nr:transporter substrate-binding domain-containing protein [Geminicoccus sp.]HEX2527595.1 transporter substrate-binding domain-containing protein [Geminicoccus sp.]
MQTSRRTTIVTAALLLMLGVTGARAGETLDRIKAEGVLKMSTDPEYPPQSSLDAATNEFVGFDIDVGREIAKRLGVEIQFVTPGWDVITVGRWAGRWDMSVGSMTPTKERAEVLDFPAVYYFTPAALVVHKDNTTIAKVEDAGGKQIGVGQATTYESYLNRNLTIDVAEAPPFEYLIDGAVVRTYETDLLALDDLRLGDGTRLDGALTALPTILDAIKRGYPLKVIGEPLFKEPLAIAIDKGDPEFGAEITRIVGEMKADGTLARLSEQYYGADLTN